jgi:hypothetical protein
MTMQHLPKSLLISLGLMAATFSACGGSTAKTGETADGGDGGGSSSSGGSSGGGSGSSSGATGSSSSSGGATPGVLAVPLYSCLPSIYTLGSTIGGSQNFQFILDTGSTTAAVASSTCTTCGVSPTYTPASSAKDQGMMATSQYGTGMWTGEIYQDSLTLSPAPAVPVDFVDIDTQTGFFENTQCDSTSGGLQGILGMGPSGSAVMGTNGYFDQFIATTSKPNIFATKLCDAGGTLWLGGYDTTATTAAPQYTPLISQLANYYYAVELRSISLNGTSVAIANAQYPTALVDTGTSAFLVGTTGFNALAAAIASSSAFSQIFGGASFFPASASATNYNCVMTTQTKAQLDAALPVLTLNFAGGATVQATATESYLTPQAANQWCPALFGVDQTAQFPVAAVLGSPILRSNVVIFDRGNAQIGFAPHTACP